MNLNIISSSPQGREQQRRKEPRGKSCSLNQSPSVRQLSDWLQSLCIHRYVKALLWCPGSVSVFLFNPRNVGRKDRKQNGMERKALVSAGVTKLVRFGIITAVVSSRGRSSTAAVSCRSFCGIPVGRSQPVLTDRATHRSRSFSRATDGHPDRQPCTCKNPEEAFVGSWNNVLLSPRMFSARALARRVLPLLRTATLPEDFYSITPFILQHKLNLFSSSLRIDTHLKSL